MKRILSSIALSAIVLAPPVTAQGQFGSSFTADQARDARQKGEIKPLNQILQPIRESDGGNMRKFVGLFERGGRMVYVIDWVTGGGDLVQYTIDASTGRVISKS